MRTDSRVCARGALTHCRGVREFRREGCGVILFWVRLGARKKKDKSNAETLSSQRSAEKRNPRAQPGMAVPLEKTKSAGRSACATREIEEGWIERPALHLGIKRTEKGARPVEPFGTGKKRPPQKAAATKAGGPGDNYED
jgi:hypothetical protein